MKLYIPGVCSNYYINLRNNDDLFGIFWSSTPDPGNAYYACSLYFISGSIYPDGYNRRCYGCPIRNINTC